MSSMQAASPRTDARPQAAWPQAAYATSWLRSCATLYWLTLRQHLHGKRWIALVVLFLLPAAMAVLIRMPRTGIPSVFLEFVLVWVLIPQALLPLAALLYASGIIRDEQEEQTITYLLTRPIPKWMLYATKMFATWTTMLVLTFVLTIITFAAIYAGSGIALASVINRGFHAWLILSLAGIAYCSLFGLIGLVTKRILVIGILYTAIVEGLFATFPFGIRMATIVYYARIIAYRTLDFLATFPHGNETDVAAVAWNLDIRHDPKLAEHPQLSTSILVLVLASIVLTALGGWFCSTREFHVKTPETE
jgi:ABC-2 type transport system permease protein